MRRVISTPTEDRVATFLSQQWEDVPEVVSGDIVQCDSKGNYFTICCTFLHLLSRGSSHIISSSASTQATIDPRYFSHPLDLAILVRHVQYTSKIASSEPLSGLFKQCGRRRAGALADLTSLEDVKEYVRIVALSRWHLIGTCVMLPQGRGGVIDHKLLVYGRKNLCIVIALATKGNCQTTVYVVAERAADLIKTGYDGIS